MDLLRTFARPLLAASFIVDGTDAVIRPRKHVEKIEAVTPALERIGLPPEVRENAELLTRASGAATVVAGIGLATGKAPRACATVLAALSLPLALVNHPVWEARGKDERVEALTGLAHSGALTAGLLLATVDREGRPSIGWRVQQAKIAHEAAKAAKEAKEEI